MDYLRNIHAEHNRKARPKAVRLSEVLSRSMTGRIEKNYEKYGQIADTFEEILGPQLLSLIHI